MGLSLVGILPPATASLGNGGERRKATRRERNLEQNKRDESIGRLQVNLEKKKSRETAMAVGKRLSDKDDLVCCSAGHSGPWRGARRRNCSNTKQKKRRAERIGNHGGDASFMSI